MASKASKRAARPAPAVSTARGPSSWPLVLAGMALAVFAYSPCLQGPFVFDDFHLPFADPRAAQMPAQFWIGGVRPVLMGSYWANYLYSGPGTYSYHAVNIALHLIAAALVWRILGRLLRMAFPSGETGWSALLGAGVFLLHPLQTESVDYIAGRSEVFCAIFVLSAWLVFLRRFGENTGPGKAALILACTMAAVLTKESGICVVALLVATDLYWNEGGIAVQLRKRRVLYVPVMLASCGAAFLILRRLAGSESAGFGIGASPAAYALTQCRVVLLYGRLFLAPAGQNVDWQIPLSSFRDPQAWVCVAGFAMLIAAIVWSYKRAREVSFGLVIFLIGLAPSSSVIPLQDAMAERRMYLPIIGLSLALAGVAHRIRIPAGFAVPSGVAVLLALAAVTHARSSVWSGGVSLWEDAVAKNPRNSRAHASLGTARMLLHDCGGAARDYKAVIAIEGLNDMDGRNLASAYECGSQPDLALEIYRRLADSKPASDLYTRIGYLEALHENLEGSLAAFGKALRLDPNNAAAYAFQGLARLAANDVDAARADFRHSLAIDPSNAVATAWLAKLPPEN